MIIKGFHKREDGADLCSVDLDLPELNALIQGKTPQSSDVKCYLVITVIRLTDGRLMEMDLFDRTNGGLLSTIGRMEKRVSEYIANYFPDFAISSELINDVFKAKGLLSKNFILHLNQKEITM